MMMRVAGPMKLQIKYVSRRSQHLETETHRDIMGGKQKSKHMHIL